jgi:hypothetical protein
LTGFTNLRGDESILWEVFGRLANETRFNAFRGDGGACIGSGAGEGSGTLRTMALLTAPRSMNVDAGVGVGTAAPSLVAFASFVRQT